MSVHLPLVVGNWKMHKTQREALGFIWDLIPFYQPSSIDIWLAVPYTAIHVSAELCNTMRRRGVSLSIGAQNMHDAAEGPFTGEIAAGMLKEAGAQFVIIGHSERRLYFGETNDFINRKVKRALEEGLRPILCIGETREEREEGRAVNVIEEQLFSGIKGVSVHQVSQLVIAYEPMWAIGTGLVASPFQAQEMHSLLREMLTKTWGKDVSCQISLLYGGSAKPENIENLAEQKEIDGFLVGGASLVPESFARIISTLSKRRKG